MSKLAITAAMISVGICSFVAPSSQAAFQSPMSSEVRAVLSAVEADTEQPILARVRGGGARVGAASRTRVAAGHRGVAASRTTAVRGPRGNVAAHRTTVVGRRGEGRELLARVYGWFTEGFDTADLKEAKRLLDKLT